MHIEPVDIRDDLALRASYDLERRSMMLGREGMPFPSWAEMSGMWRFDDPGETKTLLGG